MKIRWEDMEGPVVSFGYLPDVKDPSFMLLRMESGNIKSFQTKLDLQMGVDTTIEDAKGRVQRWVDFTSLFAPLKQRNT